MDEDIKNIIAPAALDSLAEGQRQVLDLFVAGFGTFKEIALELEIAPSTAKQRFNAAAAKLHTVGRGATIREYQRLLRACVFSVCPPEHIAISPDYPHQPPRDWGATPTLRANDAMPLGIAPWANGVERTSGLEAFVEKLNGRSTASIIVVQAIALTILAILVVTMMGTFWEFDILRFVTR